MPTLSSRPRCRWWRARLAQVDENATLLSTFTRAGSYLGGSALSLPAGFSSDGLPIGVQLMGKRFDEATLVRAGCAWWASIRRR